ncbi:MAG: pantetheine-phosphate adenylyltransferase [Clostridia bacterium]|nr:pantetheine-phosphate adenylyltransferase [Clostridia bacterium]
MEKEKKTVILPGSYDPVTLGHQDVIRKAAERYERVYAVLFVNPNKKYLFDHADRMRMLMLACEEYDNVLVSESAGLVIDYMREHDIDLIIKGYRNDADLAYEREQAHWNYAHSGYETELWLSDEKFSHISSTRVRERIASGEDLSDLVPPEVEAYIKSI